MHFLIVIIVINVKKLITKSICSKHIDILGFICCSENTSFSLYANALEAKTKKCLLLLFLRKLRSRTI